MNAAALIQNDVLTIQAALTANREYVVLLKHKALRNFSLFKQVLLMKYLIFMWLLETTFEKGY